MSDSYYLACTECKAYVWVGQSQNSDHHPFCFYSGEPKTMEQLKMFLWDHQGHSLVMDDSQVLASKGTLTEDENGRILGEYKEEIEELK